MFVNNDYVTQTPGCVTGMLGNLEWESLQRRRQEARLVMLYRIQYGLVDILKDEYLKSDDRTRSRFSRERITKQVYANTFFPRTIVDCNKLPTTATGADSLEAFRAWVRAYPM